MFKKLLILTALAFCALTMTAQETYLYAKRDTCNLFMDIYRPSEGADTTFEGVDKPAILFLFGGGFVTGARTDDFYQPWYKLLNDNGYTVIAIDYRLGMKGYQIGKGLRGMYKACEQFKKSQDAGVEDVFSAINFLSDNKDETGIDPDNLVIAGSSAGAIIAMACEYEIVNGGTLANALPEGYNFRGVMSFAGAIISISGAPVFAAEPCPMLMFHGTADKAVSYKHLGTIKRGNWGSSHFASQFARKGYPYVFYRFKNRTHDVAAYIEVMWDKEKDFLEQDVMLGGRRTIDEVIDDPTLPSWGNITLKSIY